MTIKVFCYGTLKQGRGNDHWLRGAKFIGEDTTKDNKYTMLNLGYYPGVLLEGGTTIMGEVYEVEEATLLHLDTLEGYPDFYNRTTVSLKTHGEALMYYLSEEASDDYDLVASGNW